MNIEYFALWDTFRHGKPVPTLQLDMKVFVTLNYVIKSSQHDNKTINAPTTDTLLMMVRSGLVNILLFYSRDMQLVTTFCLHKMKISIDIFCALAALVIRVGSNTDRIVRIVACCLRPDIFIF